MNQLYSAYTARLLSNNKNLHAHAGQIDDVMNRIIIAIENETTTVFIAYAIHEEVENILVKLGYELRVNRETGYTAINF